MKKIILLALFIVAVLSIIGQTAGVASAQVQQATSGSNIPTDVGAAAISKSGILNFIWYVAAVLIIFVIIYIIYSFLAGR